MAARPARSWWIAGAASAAATAALLAAAVVVLARHGADLSGALADLAATNARLDRSEREARDEARAAAERRRAVEEALAAAEEERAARTRDAYRTHLGAAAQALELGDLSELARHLEEAPDELRDWEWDHLALVLERQTETLVTHEGFVQSLAASADGRWLVSASSDGEVRVTEWPSGATRAVLAAHDDEVLDVDVARDGSVFATASEDGTARVWSLPDGAPLTTLDAAEDGVTAVALVEDGRLVTGSYDGVVRVWSWREQRELLALRGHEEPINALAAAPNGRLVSVADERVARVWDVERGAEVARLEGHEDWIFDAAIDAAGRRIATASEDRTVRLWDARSGRELEVLRGHEDSVLAVAFAPRGDALVSASYDGALCTWAVPGGGDGGPRRRLLLEGRREDPVHAVAPSPGLRSIAFARGGDEVRGWSAEPERGTAEVAADSDARGELRAIAADESGMWIALGDEHGGLVLLDAASGVTAASVQAHERSVTALAFDARGKLLASGDDDGVVRLWTTAPLAPLRTLAGLEREIGGVGVSANGERVLAIAADGAYVLWDAASGAAIATKAGPRGGVFRASCSADARWAFWAGDGGIVRVWDPETGERALGLRNTALGLVTALAVSSDLSRVVAVSNARTVLLLDGESGTTIGSLEPVWPPVSAVDVHPYGERVLVGTRDGAVGLWDATEGACVWRARPRDFELTAARFDPLGLRLYAAAADGRLLVYFSDTEDGVRGAR